MPTSAALDLIKKACGQPLLRSALMIEKTSGITLEEEATDRGRNFVLVTSRGDRFAGHFRAASGITGKGGLLFTARCSCRNLNCAHGLASYLRQLFTEQPELRPEPLASTLPTTVENTASTTHDSGPGHGHNSKTNSKPNPKPRHKALSAEDMVVRPPIPPYKPPLVALLKSAPAPLLVNGFDLQDECRDMLEWHWQSVAPTFDDLLCKLAEVAVMLGEPRDARDYPTGLLADLREFRTSFPRAAAALYDAENLRPERLLKSDPEKVMRAPRITLYMEVTAPGNFKLVWVPTAASFTRKNQSDFVDLHRFSRDAFEQIPFSRPGNELIFFHRVDYVCAKGYMEHHSPVRALKQQLMLNAVHAAVMDTVLNLQRHFIVTMADVFDVQLDPNKRVLEWKISDRETVWVRDFERNFGVPAELLFAELRADNNERRVCERFVNAGYRLTPSLIRKAKNQLCENASNGNFVFSFRTLHDHAVALGLCSPENAEAK